MTGTTFRTVLGAAMLLVLGAAIPCSADTMFFDGTFKTSNYTVAADYNSSPTAATLDISRCSHCGDPEFGERVVLALTPSSTVNFVSTFSGLLNNSWVYDPSTQGAITSLDYSVDKKLKTNAGSVTSNTGIPFLEQDGNFYVDFLAGPTTLNSFELISGAGLVASDFGELVLSPTGVTDNPAINPNFSATGDPIDFGFGIRLNEDSASSRIRAVVKEDNVSYDLTTVPVPEPSSIVLLLAGMGVIGWFGLRRRKAARVLNGAA